MCLYHHAWYRRAGVLPVNSPYWSSCYPIVENTTNCLSTSCHVPGNIESLSHMTEFWPLECEWKSYVPLPGLEKSCMCIQFFTLIFPPLAWSRPLKPHVEDGRATEKRTWVPESSPEREPATNKENPFRTLQEQELLSCLSHYTVWGVYGSPVSLL